MAEAKISCSNCGGHIIVPRELAGQEVACPHCQQSILLPKPKLPTAWIIAVISTLITVCLAFALFWERHMHDATLTQANSAKTSVAGPAKIGGSVSDGTESEDVQAMKNVCRNYYNAINNQDFKGLQNVWSGSSRNVLAAEDVKGLLDGGAKYEFIDLESVRLKDGAVEKCAAAKAKRTVQSPGMGIQEGWRELTFVKDSSGWKLFPSREISEAIVSQFINSGFTEQVKEKIRLLRDEDPFDFWDKNDTNVLAAVFKLSEGKAPVFPWDVEFRVESNNFEGYTFALSYSVRNKSLTTWDSPFLQFELKQNGKAVLTGNDLLPDIAPGNKLTRDNSFFLSETPQENTKYDLDVFYPVGFPQKSIQLAQNVPIELKVQKVSSFVKLEIISTQFDLATSDNFQDMLSARINYRVKNISTKAIKNLDVKCVWYTQTGEQLDQSTDYVVGLGDVQLGAGQFKTGYIRCGKGYRNLRVPVKVDIYLESDEKRSLVYKGLLIK